MKKMSITGTKEQIETFKEAVFEACLLDPTTISECSEDTDCSDCMEGNIDWGEAADEDGKLEIACTAAEKDRIIQIVAGLPTCALYGARHNLDRSCSACIKDNVSWVIREELPESQEGVN